MGVSANQTQDRHSSRDSRAGLYLMKSSTFTTESRLLLRMKFDVLTQSCTSEARANKKLS